MGSTLEIQSFIRIKRTAEQVKLLEDEIAKFENSEYPIKGDVVSYDVISKKKIYESDQYYEYLKSQNKEYFVSTDSMELTSNTDSYIFKDAIESFYGLNFCSNKYENIPLKDMGDIIDNLKPAFDENGEVENIEHIKRVVSDFLYELIECLKNANIDDSRILSITFNCELC